MDFHAHVAQGFQVPRADKPLIRDAHRQLHDVGCKARKYEINFLGIVYRNADFFRLACCLDLVQQLDQPFSAREGKLAGVVDQQPRYGGPAQFLQTGCK